MTHTGDFKAMEPPPSEGRWIACVRLVAWKVGFVAAFVVGTLASSTVSVGWITDTIAAHRWRDAHAFTFAGATTVMQTFSAAYAMCIDVSVRQNLVNVAGAWTVEQDRFLQVLRERTIAMNILVDETRACKTALMEAQVRVTNATNTTDVLSCSPVDLAALERLSNAWSARRPSAEHWRFLQLGQSALPSVAAQVAAALDKDRRRDLEALNATARSLHDVVEMGAIQIRDRFGRLAQIATSLEASLGVAGASMTFGQALQLTKTSLGTIKAALDAIQPLLVVAGAGAAPLLPSDMDFTMDQMIQVESLWTQKLGQLHSAINDTRTNMEQWGDAVRQCAADTNASVAALAKVSVNASAFASFDDWTLRSTLLASEQHPNVPANGPRLGLANATTNDRSDKPEKPHQQKRVGWDLQIDGFVTAVPMDIVFRIVSTVAMLVLVARGWYADFPHVDNQDASTIHTTADWLGVFCCRHSLVTILSNLALVNLWPLLWTALISWVLYMVTFGLLVPINQGHSQMCVNGSTAIAATDESTIWLGSEVINFASTYVLERGNRQAIEGFYQLKSIHERTCVSYQLQFDSIGSVDHANATSLFADYGDLFAILQQFRTCASVSDLWTNATACMTTPDAMQTRVPATTPWTCAALATTEAALKGPCMSTIAQDFKTGAGKEQACALERSVLETVSLFWVWWLVFVTLNAMRIVLLKAAAIFLWRRLSGGRMPFTGFVDDAGAVLDQVRLVHRRLRHEDEFRLRRRFYCSAAVLCLGFGLALIVATLSSLH
ncbi:Aste57867_11356 [Aphanomyces stellatus]|uniref:Aste57867_11356 protein n=1 Tax=Aphanomyces stellatus TaxID=120398 RepID=A0A485KTA2_9STRA|nr:hypothetical protein As57867_011314 [Aphanomyces stellatus]VFT88218.1 Aste57867_11356 [Aphanomyces stellatus]